MAGGAPARGTPALRPRPSRRTPKQTRAVAAGQRMKFKGVVIRRDADTFMVRDRTRVDTQVLLTDNTSIKTYEGFLRGGKQYAVTDILRGLIVDVEGRGDAQGPPVAERHRFKQSDKRAQI